MLPKISAALLLLLCCGAHRQECSILRLQSPPQPPPLPKFYTTSGSIELPYAEISEPFTAFVDNERNVSRIDYYNGTVQSFQFANGSQCGFLVHPVSTETVHNRRDCLRFGGVTAPQNVVPDLAGFVFVRSEAIRGVECNVFANRTFNAGRKNEYTIWIGRQDSRPYRYDMIGYDTLLGSHYDRYYVEYLTFDLERRPSDAVFEVKSETPCRALANAEEAALRRPEMNPMAEIVHRSDTTTELQYRRFKEVHRLHLPAPGHVEARSREHAFRRNLRFINSKNRQGLAYRLAVNHLADLSLVDLRSRLRCRRQRKGLVNGPLTLNFNATIDETEELPDSVDWRIAGGVSPVKDQGICGSCWSFGVTGAMEGAYFVKTGKRVRFSQQQLVDCSWGFGNQGCNGGDDVPSYGYIQRHGLAFEEDYGRYLMQEGYCHAATVGGKVKVSGFSKVPSNNATALKVALFKNGPVSVSIDASHLSFVFYSSGVYYEEACSSTELDHSVLAVGYGVFKGQPYWLVKNSWSFYWGNNGYVLMSARNNNCGVMTAATQPVLA